MVIFHSYVSLLEGIRRCFASCTSRNDFEGTPFTHSIIMHYPPSWRIIPTKQCSSPLSSCCYRLAQNKIPQDIG